MVDPDIKVQAPARQDTCSVSQQTTSLVSPTLSTKKVVEPAVSNGSEHWNDHIERAIPDVNIYISSAFELALCESNGKPFAYDDGNIRSLHFDERMMQSAMWLEEPDELVFGYTRAMMGFMLFNPAPQHILMIGLGGGSLIKYCYRHLPYTRFTVVEVDADVIALREKFMIPADDHRLQVIHADAIEYVAHADQNVDVILLDGFNIDGTVPELNSQIFYGACQRILNPRGILVVNLWSEAANLIILKSRLHMEFDYRVWSARSIDSYNLLIFSFNSHRNVPIYRSMMRQAVRLDGYFKLGLPQFVNRLHATTTDSPDEYRISDQPQ